MIKALFLIFEPVSTWDNIIRARRSLRFIFGTYLLPLLLLTSAAEGFGLVYWGRKDKQFQLTTQLSVEQAVIFELAQLLLWLLVVFGTAKMVKAVGETFQARNSFTQAFTIVVYGLGPMLMLRLLQALPGVNPYVYWGIGICLAFAILYHGVPRVLEPDPSHAFGLYIMSTLLLALTTGAARFATEQFLDARFLTIRQLLPG